MRGKLFAIGFEAILEKNVITKTLHTFFCHIGVKKGTKKDKIGELTFFGFFFAFFKFISSFYCQKAKIRKRIVIRKRVWIELRDTGIRK